MIKYIFIFILLTGSASLLLTSCNYVCPDKTTVNIGTTEVDSDNNNKNKIQKKKSITQTWMWGKVKCQDK
jgi:hypothetical protein